MQIEGFGPATVLTLMAETGLSLSQFPSAKHFASWLALCPNKTSPAEKSCPATPKKIRYALRKLFGQLPMLFATKRTLTWRITSGAWLFLHGRKVTITATARKLSLIVYNMLVLKKPYQPLDPQLYQEKVRSQKIKNIQRTMRKLNIDFVELAAAG